MYFTCDVLSFSLYLCFWNSSPSRKNSARYYHNLFSYSRKLQDTLPRFYPKFVLSPQILIKFPNIKISRKSFSGSRVVPWGRTDRRTYGHMTDLIIFSTTLRKYLQTQAEQPGKIRTTDRVRVQRISFILISVKTYLRPATINLFWTNPHWGVSLRFRSYEWEKNKCSMHSAGHSLF